MQRRQSAPTRRRRAASHRAAGRAAVYSCYCLYTAATALSGFGFESTGASTATTTTALVLNTPVVSSYRTSPYSSSSSSSKGKSTSWWGFRQAQAGITSACTRSSLLWGDDVRARGGSGRGSSSSYRGEPSPGGRRGGAGKAVMSMNGGGDGGGVGGVGGVWDAQDEEEWEFEEEVQRLEKRLAAAVKKEDYQAAAKARDKLFRIHMDETSSVLSTNSAFYAAFTAKDADRMASLWLPSNDVMCIHPGDEPIVGHQAVSRSWRSLFSSGDSRFSTSIIKPTDVKIRVRGTTAVVQCNEEVTTGGPPHETAASWLSAMKAEIATRAGGKGTEAKGTAARGSGGTVAAEEAFPVQLSSGSGSGGGGSVGTTKKKKKPRYLNVTNIFRKAGGRWLMVHHHASLPPPPQSNKELRTTMGLGGLHLGEGADGMPRIINLGDQSFNVENGKMDGKLDEMIESLRSQLPGGGSFNLGGPISSGSMLVIGEADDDDEDEGDDEEEQDEDDDGDDGDDEVDVEDALESDKGSERGNWGWGKGRPVTGSLTKKTMQALRLLGEEHVLGRREQRRLITDVIEHAATEKASVVEVAYELLVGHNNEDLQDASSLTEFVDQCKILASSLFAGDRERKRRK